MPSLVTLNRTFRPMAEALLAWARLYDPRFTITSAKRTRTEQARLYSKWRAGQSAFPALPPGRSMHERGYAVDMIRLNVDPTQDALLHEIGAAWRRAGGVWGGEVDPVHFEAPKRLTGRR